MPNHIINKQHSKLDFVNILTNSDVELFLDPTKLHSQHLHPLFRSASKKLHSFFLEVYRVFIEEGESKVRQLLHYSSECNFIHFGYSSNLSKGTGASEQLLFDFFKKIMTFEKENRERLLHPASIAIFVPKFAEDRTSDFLISILKKEIIEYTLVQAKVHDLNIENSEYDFGYYWNDDNLEWEKIKSFHIKSEFDKPILLIPKCLVSQKYKFSTGNFVKSVIFPNKRNLEKYQGINGFDKNNNPKPATQKQLIELEIRTPYAYLPDKWKTYAMNQLMENHNWYTEYFKNMNNFADNHVIPDDLLDEIVGL